MKIGLDYHGVIDKFPGYFRIFSESLIKAGHEVHIITGLRKQDIEQKIPHTHFYSVSDDLVSHFSYHINKEGRPIFEDDVWNKAKAKYCKENKIDLMIDDSKIYGKYFSTPYFQYGSIK